MEAETLERTLVKSSSLEQEQPKTQDPDVKTLKKAFRTGVNSGSPGGGSRRGERVRVSENGGGRAGRGRGRGRGGEGLSNEVVLEDSAMNGASTLLKMQQSGDGGLRGLGSVLDAIDSNEMTVDEEKGAGANVNGGLSDANEGNPDGETVELSGDDDEGDEWGEFAEGDFVWGKIRSHPWWPGRIYNPLDASDYANKVKQGDKVLVAYFGDGTFAWCNPSQLKPLEEDFVESSKQSGSRNFVNAVEKTLDEVNRLVDLKMTCSCVPKENLIGFGQTLALNAGVKEGLLVPEGGVRKFSSGLFEPSHCLSALKSFAQLPVVDNMLEFTVMKGWLSAFYRTNGGHQLPTYHDPLPVPGLDDETQNWVGDTNYSKGEYEAGAQVPTEEDWLSSHQNSQSLLQRCPEVPEDKLYQRRKQKSIAEIIGGNADAGAESKEDNMAGTETNSGKRTSTVERKKRKGRDEHVDLKGKDYVTNVAGGNATLPTPTMIAVRKERKVSNQVDGEGKGKFGDEPGAGANEGTPVSSSRRRKKKKGMDEVNVDGENTLTSRPRKNKEAKLSESSESAGNPVSSLIKDGSEVQKGHSSSGRKKRGSSGDRNRGRMDESGKIVNVTVSVEKQDGGANGQVDKGYSPRERKKSKYLSPPYANVRRGHKKEELEAESVKVSIGAQVGEQMTRAAGNLIESPILKSRDETLQLNNGKESDAAHKTSVPGLQTPKQDQTNVFDPMKVKAPANEVLFQVRSAACNPLYTEESNSLDVVKNFLSSFRSSIFSKRYEQNQSSNQRESKKSNPVSVGKEQDLADHGSLSQQSKTRKRRYAESDKSKEKKAAGAPNTNTNDKDYVEDPAALFVTFGPGSILPTKADLVEKYRKYGALKVEDTDMFYQNHCARITFLKSSEAEEAFNDSQLVSPFEKASTTFRLRYLSCETKTRELKEISGAKPSPLVKEGANAPANPSTPQSSKPPTLESSSSDVSQPKYIKAKLEGIAAMLETLDGKISPNMKSKLQGEIKGLLEKVSTMVEPSS